MHVIDKLEDHFDTSQAVRSVCHFVYEFVEFVIVLGHFSFVIVLGHGHNPILSSKALDKLDVRVRLLLWKQERRMCETMQSSHRLRPAMALVRASVHHCRQRRGVGWELGRLYKIFILSCVWSGESWAELERLGEKWWKGLIIKLFMTLSQACLFVEKTDNP
jgi:hypothetical protein